jgi:hypothetical protein
MNDRDMNRCELTRQLDAKLVPSIITNKLIALENAKELARATIDTLGVLGPARRSRYAQHLLSHAKLFGSVE